MPQLHVSVTCDTDSLGLIQVYLTCDVQFHACSCYAAQSLERCSRDAHLKSSLDESPKIKARPHTKTPASQTSAMRATASSPRSHMGSMKRRNSMCTRLSTISAITCNILQLMLDTWDTWATWAHQPLTEQPCTETCQLSALSQTS